MKQTKKLTRSQKILLSNKGMDPANFRLVLDLPEVLILYNTVTRMEEVIEK